MLRTQRATASLIRALIIGTALPALVVGAASLVGCQDESQPEYWVEKLDDNAWRVRAIKQLDQFYEDAVTRANQAGDSPEVKALAEKIVVPLTATYVAQYDNLDEKTRHRLIKLLASLRDPRTEPALTKALSEFAQKGRGGEDLKWSARAVADMKLTNASDELLGAFLKLRADTEEGSAVYRDLNVAMLDVADKAWTKPLIEKLEPTLELPKPGEQNKEKVTEFRNQQFWQTTATQLLGAIGDPAAVDPLLKVLLDPAKANLHADAVVSLVKIGKPAVARATQLLAGEDKELVEFAALRARKASGMPVPPGDAPHVRTAAIVLGTVGHASAAPALIAALQGQNDANRAVILRELAKLPASPQIKQAFQTGFVGLSPDAMIPPGQPALQVLAESATSFFDPGFVPWLLQQAAAVKKDDETRSALLVAAIKLMLPDQVAAVGAAVDKYGSELEKSVFAEAAGLIKGCGQQVNCYFETATKPTSQEDKSQFIGIKAAYMLGILGNEKVRDQLVTGVDPISNAAVRFTAAKVIDYLSPKGSIAAADELQKMVDANLKRGDRDKIAGDAPLKQVIYRLRSRAQS
jgi:PBS lyase HEAT-like repeat-containing protein